MKRPRLVLLDFSDHLFDRILPVIIDGTQEYLDTGRLIVIE